MKSQPFWIGLLSGGITAMVTATVTTVKAPNFISRTEQYYLIASTAGITSFLTTLSLSMIATRQLRSSTHKLGDYLEAISEGNYNVRAPIYPNDELRCLTEKFNNMADAICNIFINIKIREEKSKQEKEKIAAQVIKLLDKVDAAAHGKLDVKVRVRCEELGIISYCINLSLDNFRKLVKQVNFASQKIEDLATNSQSVFKRLSWESQCQSQEIAFLFETLQMILDVFHQRKNRGLQAHKVYEEIDIYALRSYAAINHIFDEIMEAHILISQINHKVQRFSEYNYDLIKIMDLLERIQYRSKILAFNISIYGTRKINSEEILEIATELKDLANYWELVQKKIAHFQRNIEGLNLSIAENNLSEKKEQSKISGEEVKRGLAKIIQKVYQFNNHVDAIASLGENQTNNLQLLTEILQAIHKNNLEKYEVTKQVNQSLETLSNIKESLLASARNFRL
ncbi:MAG: methyl-accepting chemotaxis protein [Microcoleaceae cyanobacterium MO_207.B10]|nr:methyl-accepting chemotaxis protein [Microcoleaceae cyanobacterium MO_207.B10]